MRRIGSGGATPNSPIWDFWLNGQNEFVGNSRPNGYVTVEQDWFLNPTSATYGGSLALGQKGVLQKPRGPYRWFQHIDDDQVETPLDNVKSIDIDRSVDTDSASCNIVLDNFRLDFNNPVELEGQLGQPGYYTWSRGKSADAVARWNHDTNEWEDVIVPNALLRTYQGYGGYDNQGVQLSLDEALESGNVVLTGVWLVDAVSINAFTGLTLRCRDMAKLLIEQVLFPPLVPSRLYTNGLKFCRWYESRYDAKFSPRPQLEVPNATGGNPQAVVKMTYKDSSADRWYGFNANIHGHTGTHSVDGKADTFAMSVGNSHPSREFCTDYFEYEPAGPVEQVYVHPWGGNYTMYISVKENGVWKGADRVPYDHTPLIGNQPTVVDTEADELYVLKTATGWETGQWYKLPRKYNAERVRITFRNHIQSQHGPWYYRCGIREIKAGYGVRAKTGKASRPTGVASVPWVFGATPIRNPDDDLVSGYLCVDESGRVFAFGDARKLPKNDTKKHTDFAVAIRSICIDGEYGYWVLQVNGRVMSYGIAEHYGESQADNKDYIDMAPTRTGLGYYLLRRNGTVVAFGDAVHYGNAVDSGNTSDARQYTGTGIETHPTLDGYWITDGNGEVQSFGSLPDYGGISPLRSGLVENEWVRAIRRNSTGDGYWLLSGGGKVYHKGAATHHGNIPGGQNEGEGFAKLCWDLIPCPDDEGYLILQADGQITPKGEAGCYWGSPGGTGILRKPGNYLDYADIVRIILLWSGWTLFEGESPNFAEGPQVYGNIEYTGAYADECINVETFDKKPPIDVINTIKEIVGYLFWIDDEGAARFHSPNWWKAGNFWDDGEYTTFIPEIDEATVLTEYQVNYSDSQARSQIIISSEQPESNFNSTVTTKYVPPTSDILRGMVKPAIWTNGVFIDKDEQRIMAELIGMHIWFSTRVGSVTCLANPAIQIDDQVRIFERQTAETYIHYVRGVSTSMNLIEGTYTMRLDTNWLGDQTDWIITSANIQGTLQPTARLQDWLANSSVRGAKIARLDNFGDVGESTDIHSGGADPIPDGDPGSANG